MREWLAGEYRAVIFVRDGEPVGYALYRDDASEIDLRQFFVRRGHRRQGIGREAVGILRQHAWPQHKRLTVEVLTANAPDLAFWHSVGFRDYCLTLEIWPRQVNQ
jgi:predicted acetyltransferase